MIFINKIKINKYVKKIISFMICSNICINAYAFECAGK